MNKKELEQLLLSDNDKIIMVLEKNKDEIFDLIPELKKEYGFPQNNPWHIYDVWNHTLNAMKYSKNDIQIRLTLLLHDIGKPYLYQDDENGIRHFKGHADKSAEIASGILNSLGYSKKDIDEITYLIKNHSTVIDVDNINEDNIKLLKELLYIQYCDSSAYNPEYVEKSFDKLDKIKEELIQREKKLGEKNSDKELY